MTEPSNAPEQSTSPATGAAGDARFVLAVGVLLVVIIGMLAFLWMRERRTRIGLENDLAEVRKDSMQRMTAMQALQGLMAQTASPGAGGGVELFSWQRDRVGDVKALVEGQPCAGVRITRQAGERLGFRPGDVICVSTTATVEAPVDAPASAPARTAP